MLMNNYDWVYLAAQTLLPKLNVTISAWSQQGETWNARFLVRNDHANHMLHHNFRYELNSEIFEPVVVKWEG